MNSAIRIGILTATLVLSGCATTNPKDPLEGFNRVMFNFNDAVDQTAVKPAAQAYSALPTFLQTGVGNFFGNLGDVSTAINNFLQGKPADGLSDVMRVAVNSTMGLGGLLDIGTEAGLPKHKEDFGQTLGKWGVKSGPYIVLPLLGSSTLRDTVALPLDFQADPWWHYTRPVHIRNLGAVLRAIDQRAAVLEASNLIEEAALDRYVFVRDAYMQRRESKVHDGESPTSTYEYDVGPTLAGPEEVDLKQAPAVQHAPEIGGEPKTEPVVKLEQNGPVDFQPAATEKEIKQ
jgi:phospholipid-binding lipoprotein MlaA